MILFLPVSTFTASFEVSSARPFGRLEQLLLRTIRDGGPTSIAALKDAFRLHERVLMEAVVTLFYSGYLGLLGMDLVYIGPTPSPGAAEADLGHQAQTESRYLPLIQERVTGQILRRDAVRFVPRSKLRNAGRLGQGFEVPGSDLPPEVDPGQVIGLLGLRAGSHLADIGPVLLQRAGQDVIVATVDVAAGRVHNLPPEWQAALADVLVLWARHFHRTLPKDDPRLREGRLLRDEEAPAVVVAARDNVPGFEVAATDVSLAAGQTDRLALLLDIVDRATSHLLLLLPHLFDETIADLDKPLRTAIQRGVNIDLLWGHEPESRVAASHRAALERLKRIEYDTRVQQGTARLLVGRAPSGVRATMIAGDCDARPFVVLGGDFGAYESGEVVTGLSLRLDGGGAVALLYRVLADICADDKALFAGSSASWLRYQAAEIDRIAATEQDVAGSEMEWTEHEDEALTTPPSVATVSPSKNGAVRVRLLIDRHHEVALDDAVKQARHRLDIGSVRLTAPGLHSRMAKPEIALKRRGVDVVIYHGPLALQPADRGRLAEVVEKPGGRLALVPALRHGFLIQDDERVVVSSHDWLDGYPRQVRPFGVDIGIELLGAGIGSEARKALGLVPEAEPTSVRQCEGL